MEIRSFLDEEKYKELDSFFKENAQFLGEEDQETIYLTGEKDLRIQRSDSHSKIWLKEGNMHDKERKEVELPLKKEDYEKAKELFFSLGYETEIMWKRKRKKFKWEDIDVSLDHTKGYGCIIELERTVSEKEGEGEYERLKEKLEGLGVEITPKEEFQKRFQYYKENWKELLC